MFDKIKKVWPFQTNRKKRNYPGNKPELEQNLLSFALRGQTVASRVKKNHNISRTKTIIIEHHVPMSKLHFIDITFFSAIPVDVLNNIKIVILNNDLGRRRFSITLIVR